VGVRRASLRRHHAFSAFDHCFGRRMPAGLGERNPVQCRVELAVEQAVGLRWMIMVLLLFITYQLYRIVPNPTPASLD
jgi:hypothetical protein